LTYERSAGGVEEQYQVPLECLLGQSVSCRFTISCAWHILRSARSSFAGNLVSSTPKRMGRTKHSSRGTVIYCGRYSSRQQSAAFSSSTFSAGRTRSGLTKASYARI
jgi:hypothetical protein